MGISMISDGVTLSMASLRKFAVAITLIVLMTASTLSGRGKARRLVQYDGDLTPTSTVRNDLFGQIRQRVTDMEYPATTAEDLVAIVSRWTTPRGQSVLPVLQGILVRTRQACKEGVISRSQLAQTEEKVVAGLCAHTHKYGRYQVEGDWEKYTWEIDVGNAGRMSHADPHQTFVDVVVHSDGLVEFNTWQGEEGEPFKKADNWTVKK